MVAITIKPWCCPAPIHQTFQQEARGPVGFCDKGKSQKFFRTSSKYLLGGGPTAEANFNQPQSKLLLQTVDSTMDPLEPRPINQKVCPREEYSKICKCAWPVCSDVVLYVLCLSYIAQLRQQSTFRTKPRQQALDQTPS